MFLVVTRNFPPDVGGMQSLMGGLSESLLNHGPVKVFTHDYPNSISYDSKSSMNIERIKGFKFFRKYRIANLVNNFIKNKLFNQFYLFQSPNKLGRNAKLNILSLLNQLSIKYKNKSKLNSFTGSDIIYLYTK